MSKLQRQLARAIQNYNEHADSLERWRQVVIPRVSIETHGALPVFIRDEIVRLVSRIDKLNEARENYREAKYLMELYKNPTEADLIKLRLNNKLNSRQYSIMRAYLDV